MARPAALKEALFTCPEQTSPAAPVALPRLSTVTSAAEFKRRAELDLSLGELRERVGLTFQQIRKFENGVNRVPASRLADIAAALEASPGDLFPPGSGGTSELQRGDLSQVLDIIAELIDYHDQSIKELRRFHRRLAELLGGERNERQHRR